ncbi:MAG: putative sulfate exporter family transporter [Patescibacteria group bacterium]|jgi:uncharacterized integral membrane protein (TIGR00698 family)
MLKNILNLIPGLLLTGLIAVTATWLGGWWPIIGAAVFGIFIGIIVNNLIKIPVVTQRGINFSAKIILQLAIILLGSTLSLTQIVETGAASFLVMIFTIATAFIVAFGVGKLLGIDKNIKQLIAVGTAVCGGSAIAAIAPIIKAKEHEIAYSISTVFLCNVLAVLIFPPLGHWLGLSDYGFGILAGTAINDTSSVVAAGYTFSNTAGDFATIVKLTRTTMLIPISLIFMILVLIANKKNHTTSAVKYNIIKILPWFILGFIGLAIINSTGIINQTVLLHTKTTAKFMIVMALSAVGLKTDFKKMLQSGFKPLLVGALTWLSVSITSLAVQYFTGQL